MSTRTAQLLIRLTIEPAPVVYACEQCGTLVATRVVAHKIKRIAERLLLRVGGLCGECFRLAVELDGEDPAADFADPDSYRVLRRLLEETP